MMGPPILAAHWLKRSVLFLNRITWPVPTLIRIQSRPISLKHAASMKLIGAVL